MSQKQITVTLGDRVMYSQSVCPDELDEVMRHLIVDNFLLIDRDFFYDTYTNNPIWIRGYDKERELLYIVEHYHGMDLTNLFYTNVDDCTLTIK